MTEYDLMEDDIYQEIKNYNISYAAQILYEKVKELKEIDVKNQNFSDY